MATFASVSHAMAQESTQDAEWAHTQFNKALRDNDNKDYAGARKILLEVWAKSKTYDVASELARSEYQLGHVAASAKYTAFALANVPPREGAGFTESTVSRLAWAKRKIYSAKVKLTPRKADVFVDGVKYDVPIELGLYLEPGTHELEFRCEGYATEKRTIDAKANVQEELVVNLASASVVEPAPAATLASSVKTTPSPDTSNTKLVPTAPTAATAPTPTAPNATAAWTVLGVGGGLTALALGIGIYYHYDGSQTQEDADALSATVGSCDGESTPDCSRLHQLLTNRSDDYTKAKAFYGVGAGLAVATGVLTWVLWPKKTNAPSTTVTGWLTPDSGGLAAIGSF